MKISKFFRIKDFRLTLLVLLYFLGAGVIIIRLFFIQVVNHKKYEVLAQEQHWVLQEIPARRGNIQSSDSFILAGTQTHYLLFAEPDKITNKDLVASSLANLLYTEDVLAETQRIKELLHLDLQWVILKRGIIPSQKEQLEKESILGIGFEEEPVRYYSENVLAAHILGFVADNGYGEQQGYFGIEGKFDGDLKGKLGRVIQEKDALGAPILLGGYQKVSPIDGRTINLTIDRAAQFLVERILKSGVERYDAISGSVIVMNPLTSEVIAMANFPTYHPSDFSMHNEKEDSRRVLIEKKNLAISEVYEPGSVMKPFTVLAALDLGKVTPATTFMDEGPVKYSDYYIDNWDGKHYGVQTVSQLLEKSNNIGAAWVGHLVGAKHLAEYLRDFGFGVVSGIDLEGEDTGVIREYKNWTAIDLATISFGQGISATPLQVLNAFNVIANGGELFRPRIVQNIVDGRDVLEIPVKRIRRVMSKEAAETMVGMLINAVSQGEAKFFSIKNYDIAGKTGTAQIPKEGKYDPNNTNATFVGFLAKSKKFSMIVRLDRPASSIYAAETAVPLWMEIADALIKYYGISPDR